MMERDVHRDITVRQVLPSRSLAQLEHSRQITTTNQLMTASPVQMATIAPILLSKHMIQLIFVRKDSLARRDQSTQESTSAQRDGNVLNLLQTQQRELLTLVVEIQQTLLVRPQLEYVTLQHLHHNTKMKRVQLSARTVQLDMNALIQRRPNVNHRMKDHLTSVKSMYRIGSTAQPAHIPTKMEHQYQPTVLHVHQVFTVPTTQLLEHPRLSSVKRVTSVQKDRILTLQMNAQEATTVQLDLRSQYHVRLATIARPQE